jgi:plastocyanin
VRTKRAVLGGLVAVMIMGLVACGGGGDDNVLGGRGTADLVIVDDKPPFYDNGTLKLRLNQEVSFTIFNDGKQTHNIVIPAFDIDMDIPSKQSVTVKIPAVSQPPRDGFFSFYCKYHQSQGEQGRIEIMG